MTQQRRDGIFISYRRVDSVCIAGRLRDYLNDAFPDQVFIDVESISLGRDFVAEIRDGMSRCRLLLMIVGPRWRESRAGAQKQEGEADYVASELRLALEEQIPIIPILVDGATMPTAQDPAVRNDVRDSPADAHLVASRIGTQPILDHPVDGLLHLRADAARPAVVPRQRIPDLVEHLHAFTARDGAATGGVIRRQCPNAVTAPPLYGARTANHNRATPPQRSGAQSSNDS